MRQEITLLTRHTSSIFAALNAGIATLVLLDVFSPQTGFGRKFAGAVLLASVVLNVFIKLDGIWRAIENLKGDVK